MRTRVLLPFAACAALAATCRHDPPPAPAPPRPASELAPAGLGERAYEHVAALVALGPRHPGSPGWAQAVDYIAAELRELGLEPKRDRWTDPAENLAFENISAVIPGRSPDRILIGCHHDTKKTEGHPTPEHNFHFVGANDSASGVGLLLALAAELRGKDRDATIEVVFFDGEESLDWAWNQGKRALFGSRRFLANEREAELLGRGRGKLRAMVLLDMVGAKSLQIDEETNSDPELVGLVRAAATRLGVGSYFFARRIAVSDDHLPFVQAGIPAIDLIDIADNPQWHTPQDTLEHISAESLQIVGAVVLEVLPDIERRYVPAPGTLQVPRGR